MRHHYHLIVFDWEGTLGDTVGQLLQALALQSHRLNLGEFDTTHARQYLCFGLSKTVKKLFPEITPMQYDALLQAVQHDLANGSTDGWLFPGAYQLLSRLRDAGKLLAIATNRGAYSLHRALEQTNLTSFFDATCTADETAAKPCPQMLETIMASCHVDPAHALMIGDSVVDMEMAALAGVDSIGVDFSHQQRTVLLSAGAIDVFDDYQKLADYLQSD